MLVYTASCVPTVTNPLKEVCKKAVSHRELSSHTDQGRLQSIKIYSFIKFISRKLSRPLCDSSLVKKPKLSCFLSHNRSPVSIKQNKNVCLFTRFHIGVNKVFLVFAVSAMKFPAKFFFAAVGRNESFFTFKQSKF